MAELRHNAPMKRALCDVVLAIFLSSVAACGEGAASGDSARDPSEVARRIMRSAEYCALVTVDANGQPRARTVNPFPVEDDMVVWVATRPVTRKVEQIRANPRVTLYYFDAERLEYVTLMGRARLVDDLEEKRRRRNLLSYVLYPDWPDDCLLIEVTPEWMEVQGKGVEPDAETWRPQSVEFPGG